MQAPVFKTEIGAFFLFNPMFQAYLQGVEVAETLTEKREMVLRW